MTTLFSNPMLAAAAISCVVLPIVIHLLFRRKRKPVAFGAMRFLIEAFRRQRRRLRFEQWLLLALRCLLVLCVAAAVGRPLLAQLGRGAGSGPHPTRMFLDDGLTSTRTNSSGTAWNGVQSRARDLLSELDAARGDRAGVVLLGGGPVSLVMPPTSDIAGLIGEVLRHEPTAGPVRLGASMARAMELLNEEPAPRSVECVAISEWLAGSAEGAFEGLPQLPEGWTLAMLGPSQAPASNTAITGFAAEGPLLVSSAIDGAASLPVTVTLARFGPGVSRPASTAVTAALTPLALAGEQSDESRATQTVRWSAGQAVAVATLAIPISRLTSAPSAGVTDWFASVRIEGEDDAIVADDRRLLPITSRDKLEVVVIGRRSAEGVGSFSAADWYTLALTPDASGTQRRRDGATIRATTVSALDRSGLGADAVIVAEPDLMGVDGWAALRDLWKSGTLVVVSPSASAGDQRWADALALSFDAQIALGRTSRAIVPTASARPGPAEDGGNILKNLGAELAELLPSVRVLRVLDVVEGSPRSVLETANEAGVPLLVELSPRVREGGEGRIMLFTIAPDPSWSNLVATPLMVPLMQEIIRSGAPRSRLTATTRAGSAAALTRVVAEWRPHRAADGSLVSGMSIDSVPAVRSGGVPVHAGVFDARDAEGARVAWVGVHAADGASDTATIEAADLQAAMTPLGSRVTWLPALAETKSAVTAPSATSDRGESDSPAAPPSNTLSFRLLAVALLLAVCEAVLARMFSHASPLVRKEPAVAS